MQELSGNPAGHGGPVQRIEAGPGGYDQGDSYGGDRGTKPWERGPTGAAAPWQQDRGDRDRDDYGSRDQGGAAPPWAVASRNGDSYGGYGGAPPGAAPWQQHAPPPPPGGAPGYGYGGYPGYGDSVGSYGAAPPPPSAPPGISSLPPWQQGAPPPPPSHDAVPPPPPSNEAPPPPPSNDYPPPPPPA